MRVIGNERVGNAPPDRWFGSTEARPVAPTLPTSSETGSGLGLFIARRIVTQHGGRMHVGPREGGGAVRTIALPCPVAEGGGYAASRADRNRGAITRGRSR